MSLTPEENATLAALLTDSNSLYAGNADDTWMLLCGFLVFFMHAGFSMLEAGSVQKKNVVNIMFKNIATITLGGFFYFGFGGAFAYGSGCGEPNSFIGTEGFFNIECVNLSEAGWFFQFAFAATAATIVSGAVAGRITLGAYFIVASVMTGFIFPVVSHWIWATPNGFLGNSLVDGSLGMIDFAGSGVVHLTGGVAALVGAIALGPRQGRFDGKPLEPSSYTLQTLGTFILWFGWYGFNCGSTLSANGLVASKVAVTTTLAPCAGAVTAIIYSRVVLKRYDLTTTLNCVLAGLVGITSGCSAVYNWAAIVIGAVAAIVYILSSKLLEKLKIDDPIGASPVHGFAGIWGCIATAIFLDDQAVADSYSPVDSKGAQLMQQVIGVLCIIAWTASLSGLLFFALMGFKKENRTKFLRVSEEVETAGLDSSEHGGDFKTHF